MLVVLNDSYYKNNNQLEVKQYLENIIKYTDLKEEAEKRLAEIKLTTIDKIRERIYENCKNK